jgi:hypothetical protein
MPFEIHPGAQDMLLEFTGGVTAREVTELHTAVCASLGPARRVIVRTEQLEDIDSSVLQLLISLRKTVPALLIEEPSEIFLAAAERCSLRRELLAAEKTFNETNHDH